MKDREREDQFPERETERERETETETETEKSAYKATTCVLVLSQWTPCHVIEQGDPTSQLELISHCGPPVAS
jgi:hypothetical protein